ncbi:hypothetical protein PMAYCL1PPCAC_05260, partial [Pristionchus mayeri]
KSSTALGKATFQIVIQSGVIISIHLTTVIAFLQFFPAEAVDFMLFVTHFGWMLTHGLPPFIYLALNKSIRNYALKSV